MIKANLVRSGLPVIAALALASAMTAFAVENKATPFPNVPLPPAEGSMPLGDSRSFPEVNLNLPIAPGPFEPAWQHEDKVVTHKDSVNLSGRSSGGAVIKPSSSK